MKHRAGGRAGRYGSTQHSLKLVLFYCLAFCLAHPALPDAPVYLTVAGTAADFVPICTIQGHGDVSPYTGQLVRTSGVVHADFDGLPAQGFYLQQPDCDADTATSDGIFIYLADGSDAVSSGDYVEVSGTVQEYHDQTEISSGASSVLVISHGSLLPAPVELAPPPENQAAGIYYESLEGMRVRMDQARVVGPTDRANDTWVVNASLGIERVFDDDPEGTGAIVRVSSQGSFQITPQAKTGDRVTDLQGALDGSDRVFTMHLVARPGLYPGDLPQEQGVQPLEHGFTLAAFNLANLFDSQDDPLTNDSVLPADEYQRRLQKRAMAIHYILAEPDILVVQEAENLAVLLALVNRPEIEADYGIVWENGPDPRGLDIALLYRLDRAALLDYQVMQGCTDLFDGLGPDGNGDIQAPANSLTCDRSGDGVPDGNRLYSRPPLVVKLRITGGNLPGGLSPQETALTVIANHWKSKIQDIDENQYTLPRRIQQAQFVGTLVQSEFSRADSDYIIVAGDLNDVPDSEPISIMKAIGLRDMTRDIERSSRYSMIYRGVSQVLDYVMDLPTIHYGGAQMEMLHINADFPVVFETIDESIFRSSDHDPLWVNIIPYSRYVFLPQILQAEQD